MNLFKDKTTEMPSEKEVVRTVMCPSESKDATMKTINTAVFENSDVKHVDRPRYGHGY